MDLNDIVIPDHGFGMKWNLKSYGSKWILSEKSVNEVGCIHTSQGLDLDYVGVIVGPDLIARNGKIETHPEKRAKSDKSLNGYQRDLKKDPEAAKKKADSLIKNTYRTLMTRGINGCYVYFTDKETAEYFKSKMKQTV